MQIVVRQISGLGNQLFQYAAARFYGTRLQAPARLATDPAHQALSHGHPRPFLLDRFRIVLPHAPLTRSDRLALARRASLRPLTALLHRANRTQVVTEKLAERYTFLPDLSIRPQTETLYLAGYWQSHQMVDAVGGLLRTELSFRDAALGKTLEVLDRIQTCEQPVSLHMRRGDYTLAAEGNIALPLDFYRQALDIVRARLPRATFFIFSDDIAFARAHLPANLPAVFVDHNDDTTSHDDLRLMAACHHHIVANSSFSWWGAWLNARADKLVIAPRFWQLHPASYHPGLLPSSWTLIP